MRVTVFDYGAGNLHSLLKALRVAGAEPVVETDPERVLDGGPLILPGVGAFGPAAERLAPGRTRIAAAIRNGLPCLGICLGLQLLAEGSDEGAGTGLGVIPGRATKLAARTLPQIGWNRLEDIVDPVIRTAGLDWAYYANSYVVRPADPGQVSAWSRHEDDRFPAAIRTGRTLGVQFHPEKSSDPGLAMIRAFLEEAR